MASVLLLTTAPALANSPEPQEDSVKSQLDRLASTLKAESERALAAAAELTGEAIDEGKDAIAEAETDLAPRLEALGKLLSEQKGRLDTLAEDWGPQLEAWSEAATSSLTELQRSAAEALDWFHDWVAKRSEPEGPIEIRV